MNEQDPRSYGILKPHDPLADALPTGEHLTQDEINGIAREAHRLLDADGIDTTVNGIPARVSATSTPVVSGYTGYYARVFELAPGQEEAFGVVFDLNDDPKAGVTTHSVRTMLFEEDAKGYRVAVRRPDETLIDDPTCAMNAQYYVRDIGDRIELYKQQQRDETAAARQVAEAARRRAERDQARREKLGMAGRTAAVIGAIGLLVPGSVVGARALGDHFHDNAIAHGQEFDAQKQSLPDGTIAKQGEAKKIIGYSQVLHDNRLLDKQHMPDAQDDFTWGEGLRLIPFGDPDSDSKENSCHEVAVHNAPNDAELVAWADYTAPEDDRNINKYTITYTKGIASFCNRNGHTQHNTKDDRIVFTLRQPSAPR